MLNYRLASSGAFLGMLSGGVPVSEVAHAFTVALHELSTSASKLDHDGGSVVPEDAMQWSEVYWERQSS